MNRPVEHALTIVTIAAVAVLAGGCGSNARRDSATTRDVRPEPSLDATSLQHLDGTLQLDGTTLTVSPEREEPVSLQLGDELEASSIAELAASGRQARVFYREGNVASVRRLDDLATRGRESTAGYITRVDDDALVLRRSDGSTRSFVIRDAERDAMEVPHLREHQAAAEKVRIWHEGGVAVGFEDA